MRNPYAKKLRILYARLRSYAVTLFMDNLNRHLVDASDGSIVENEPFLNKFCIKMGNWMGIYKEPVADFST